MKKLICRNATLFLCLITLTQNASAARLLIPAGQVVGLELGHDQVTVTDTGPKLGVFLKQGVTGVGTWYAPEIGNFGTLGHGVNNSAGELLNMTRGSATGRPFCP